MSKKTTSVLTVLLFAVATTLMAGPVAAASIQNKSCKSVGTQKSMKSVTFECKQVKGRKVWKPVKAGDKEKSKPLGITFSPSVSPSFNGETLTVTVSARGDVLNELEITEIEVFVSAGISRTKVQIASSVYTRPGNFFLSGVNNINFNWPVSADFSEFEFLASARVRSPTGMGPLAEVTFFLQEVEVSRQVTETDSPSKPSETVNEQNARRLAESYLRAKAFSRTGLIAQLEYEGFSRAVAEYGVDSQQADWKQQAASVAASYLKFRAFSYKGLFDQLIYEGFTKDEAAFGVASTGLTPSTSAAVCKPRLMESLPWASQRIAVLGLDLDRDSQGYVSVILKLRNDNSMDLRLVTFQLNYWYGLEKRAVYFNPSTGNLDHFFVKDDQDFMGIEKTSGPWSPGQIRTFKVDLRQILDCSQISFFSDDFEVTRGIGN